MKVRVIKLSQIGEHGVRHPNETLDVDYPTYMAHKLLGNVEAVDDSGRAIAEAMGLPVFGPPPATPEELQRQLKAVGAKAWRTL